MRTVYLFFIFSLLFSLVSCVDQNPPSGTLAKQVLLVYLVSDRNGLDLEALQKLEALKKVNSFGADYHLLVFSDTKFKDSGRLIEIKPDATEQVVYDFGDTNSADGDQFSNILDYVVENYKAESYGLLLFSHASGWLPEGTIGTSFKHGKQSKALSRSVLVDVDEELSLIDFANALPLKFDYIIFESCNMAGVETAYQLRNKARHIIATPAQMISPGFTDIYPDLIEALFLPTPNYYRFTDIYFNHYTSHNHDVISLSVLNTEKMDALAAVVRAAQPSIDQSVDIRSVQQFDGDVNQPLFFFDFLDFYKKVLPSKEYQKVESLVEQIVVYRKHTSQYYVVPEHSSFPIHSYSGISTYIEHDPKLDKEYNKLDWYRHTR